MSLTPNTFAPAPARVALPERWSGAGTVAVPGSKSQTNRVLVLSALADGTSTVTDAMVADDSRQMIGALRTLGITVEPLDDTARNWRIVGCGGELPDVGDVVINAGLAGTVMRFVTAIATLAGHATTVTGRPPLLARPVGELLRGLSAVGADVRGTGDGYGFPPVVVGGARPRGGAVTVDARRSSQFASALAAASPGFERGVDLHVNGLEASGYFDLTVELMRRRGIQLERTPEGLQVEPGVYRALDDRVPGDISSASHLLTVAAATASTITVTNLRGSELQPDFAILSTLEAFGCTVERNADGAITVAGPEHLSPVDVDLTSTPDQLPNVAVLAALADGRSVISGVGITRFHETDRMRAIETELTRLGIATSSTRDTVTIDGGNPRTGLVLSTYHDHRLGMAFAALALAIGDTVVDGADCVAKTFPGFWDVLEFLSVPMTRTPA
ncbi:3-phosphoshikimate 1-carboxyvinyltransferase [Nocardioides zeae]|uniref:3-phosphoshikimate 1-carboxyvinyltransferase n=1 Tax=Nocardioides zeae TaxID=1457234 RepID=A0ACC6ICX1_9ACTN|nr:3-phosphoshikimate 1-carboxyvinyltransferase [Nocardioides zeae]MDR6175552.1 3-phosphoshikimate 1-carboxyvinyltransferase [Nocardioides zeae]MDR6208483.1 3-phosphoshikimate 1-carboxyvinyltransferase [Nocardioides zeae]